MAHALFTIGYEKARLGDVVATLAAAGIATLIDVRDRPISRRPGFSKHQLAAAVEAVGIGYIHLQALGTPPEGREAGRRREWGVKYPPPQAGEGRVGARLYCVSTPARSHVVV